jgi:hypothetical protein
MQGKLSDAAAELQANLALSDGDIEASDSPAFRSQEARNLLSRGCDPQRSGEPKWILQEDNKDEVRWKRK